MDEHELGRVGGVAWQISTPSKNYKVKHRTLRRFPGGSQMAEIKGLIEGMKEAQDKGLKHVLLQTDGQTGVRWLAGTHEAAQDYTRPFKEELETLALGFDSVQVEWVRTKTHLKVVDRVSRQARVAAQEHLDARKARFVADIERKMAMRVSRRTAGTATLYDGFSATANPPQCPCRWWERVARAMTYNPHNLRPVCRHAAAAFKDAGHTPAAAADAIHEHYRRAKLAPAAPG